MVLLEHTAGQGRTLGYRFEHLAAIIAHLDGSPRVGVCLDTCHLVASGYDIVSEAGYRETFEAVRPHRRHRSAEGVSRQRFEEAVRQPRRPARAHRRGMPRRSSRSGACCTTARFAGLPILIETEKTTGAEKKGTIVADPLDMKNLDTLRQLRVRGRSGSANNRALR